MHEDYSTISLPPLITCTIIKFSLTQAQKNATQQTDQNPKNVFSERSPLRVLFEAHPRPGTAGQGDMVQVRKTPLV